MAIKDLDKPLINTALAQELTDDARGLKNQVDRALRGDQTVKLQNVQEARERVARIEKQLHEEVAHEGDLTPQEKDTLAKEEVTLRDQITSGMLTEEDMRKCPSYAPGAHLAWETANAQKIQRWKNIRQQLDPTNPEAQNLEIFRPSGATGRGYRADAAIPGKMSYTNVPQEKWDGVFGKDSGPDPLKKRQAAWTPEKRAEAAEKAKQRAAEKKAAAHSLHRKGHS